MSAGIAADLVVVQAGLLLGGLEALLHRPAAARDADELVPCGAGGAVGDVVGDLLGSADAAAGENPVPAVLAVPGPDFDAGPVLEAPAVDSFTAGAAFPLLPRLAGKQVVDGMVDGPARDDRVVAGGGHDVEDISLLQLEPPALAEAVGASGW